MADLHELIERVQVTLASSLDPDKADLRTLHQKLDSEIRQANKRLRECDALLANGHRSEAIQLAEQEPNLLDVVAILDFPELPEWNDFVAELGMTVTPELLIDVATDLNSAYNEDAPLEQHMRRFRRLSLARAPLRLRIDQIRRIARLDPSSPVWETDLKTYEETRLRQIRDEFRHARRDDDIDKLNELCSELRDNKWLVHPARQLIEHVEQAAQSLNAVYAVDRLRTLVDEMQTAQAESDLEWATRLVDEFNTLVDECRDDSTDFREIHARAMRTVRWVHQQKTTLQAQEKFEKKIERFRRSIRTAERTEDLRRKYTELTTDSQFDVPDNVTDQYDQAVRNIELRRRRRWIAIVGGVVLLGILMSIYRTYSERSAQADDLERHLNYGTIAQAEQFVAGLERNDADALSSDRFQDLTKRLERKRSAERARVVKFQSAVTAAEQLIESPEGSESFDQATAALERARDHQHATDEFRQLVHLEERIGVERAAWSTSNRNRFAARWRELHNTALELSKRPGTDVTEFDELRQALEQLRSTGETTRSDKVRIDQLLTRIRDESTRRSHVVDDAQVRHGQ